MIPISWLNPTDKVQNIVLKFEGNDFSNFGTMFLTLSVESTHDIGIIRKLLVWRSAEKSQNFDKLTLKDMRLSKALIIIESFSLFNF